MPVGVFYCPSMSHPGQVRLVRTRAGTQKELNYIELPLDSPSTLLRVVSPSTLLRTVSLSNGLSNHGSRPAKRSSSGMTDSANCGVVSKGRGSFYWAM
jgi:hypothetical protein